jgi:hypothetical protein
MAQVVECLPNKCKARCSNPSTTHRKEGRKEGRKVGRKEGRKEISLGAVIFFLTLCLITSFVTDFLPLSLQAGKR